MSGFLFCYPFSVAMNVLDVGGGGRGRGITYPAVISHSSLLEKPQPLALQQLRA